jgi:hypothetical protein
MYAQQFEKLRIQLKDQTALMASQRKLLNELQVSNLARLIHAVCIFIKSF